MAKISPVGSNMTVLHGKKYDVLFSYETPVAAKAVKTGEVFKTSKKWSATTSKHISKWLAGEKASEKPQEFFDDLDESKKDPAKQIAEALNIMLKDKVLNESNEEESEDGIWWVGSSIGIQLTKDQAESASVGGVDNESAIDELLTNPEISSQFDDISDDILKSELKEYGAWDDEELSDREMNIKRVIWLAAGEISDGLVDDMNESEEYEDLDESNINESNDPLNSKDVINSTEIEELLQSMSEDDPEFKSLNSVKSEVIDFLSEEDWQDGVDLIRYSYFEDYIEEMSRELNSEFFEANQTRFPFQEYIDWERVSRDMEINDFASTEIDDVEYKFQSH